MLLATSAYAENIIQGKMIIKEGRAVYIGKLNRDDMNVSMAAMNVARVTPPKESQHVELDLGGFVLEPAGGGAHIFSLSFPTTFDVFDLVLSFPSGTKFKEVSSTVPYERDGPLFSFNQTDVGAPQIDIVFSVEEQASGDANAPHGDAKAPDADASVPATEYDGPGILHILLTIGLAVVALVLFNWRRIPGPVKIKPDILATLNDRERSVMDLLAAEGGILSQARLRKRLDMPKSTLSNLVRDLEARKLVVRFENGSTYDVELEGRVKE